MVYGSPGFRDRTAPSQDAAHEWHHEQVTSADEARPLIETVLRGMAERGYPLAAGERLRLEMTEAVLSALQFGQRQDPHRPGLIAYRIGQDYAIVEVEGRERGALRAPVRGPHAKELRQPGGDEAPFGGRSYTWLRCNRRTGQVLVCKHLTLP
jgi:hypothetical protein